MKKYVKMAILCTFIMLTIIFSEIAISANSKEVTKVTNSSKKSIEIHYILKEYEEKVCIFRSDTEKPVKVLDVFVSSLPERDQTKLKNGIITKSMAEAMSLAEDYE